MLSDSLDHITIKGFKSIASIERLALRPINVVIGPNGSGKSNFVEAFELLHAILNGNLARYVTESGGANRVLHFGAKVTKAVSLRLSFKNKTNHYTIELASTKDDQLFPSDEAVGFQRYPHPQPYWDHLTPEGGGREAGISNPNQGQIGSWVRHRLSGWRLYHLHDTSSTSPLRKSTKTDDNRYLRADGANLAAFLYFLKQKHEASYELIERAIQGIAPFFERFELEPLRLNTDEIKIEWRHKGSDQYFDASSLSDGTLRFIALATLFLQPKVLRPSIILVDEPELGLHPAAIEVLASLIRQASVDTQVIVSTQSSFLLDYFDPEDVLVANRVNGATQIMRLAPEPLAAWLADYSLGQLWEKNEIGGRPAPE